MINKKATGAESIALAIEDNVYFYNHSLKHISGYLVQKIFLNNLNREKIVSDLLEITNIIVRLEKCCCRCK